MQVTGNPAAKMEHWGPKLEGSSTVNSTASVEPLESSSGGVLQDHKAVERELNVLSGGSVAARKVLVAELVEVTPNGSTQVALAPALQPLCKYAAAAQGYYNAAAALAILGREDFEI